MSELNVLRIQELIPLSKIPDEELDPPLKYFLRGAFLGFAGVSLLLNANTDPEPGSRNTESQIVITVAPPDTGVPEQDDDIIEFNGNQVYAPDAE